MTLLAGLSLGYFMVLLDLTIVSVALPSIAGSLHTGLSGLQWVTNGYTVTFAALLLTAGWLADRFGARRIFLYGLTAFGILSGLCAVATGVEMLVGLRLALGAAGAMLLPSSLAVITHVHREPAARARAVGMWAAITGAALAAGPVVGGALTELAGWRAIFLVNVPLAVAGLVVTLRLAPETARTRRGRPDLVGQVSAVVVVAAPVYALIEGPARGWTTSAVLGAALLTAVAAVVLVRAGRRAGAGAMLPPDLFRDRGVPAALVAGLLANFALSGLLFVLALYFQDVRGYSPWTAGLAFLPLTVPTAVNPIVTGRWVARIGPRRPAMTGFVLMATGALVLTPLTAATTTAGLLVFGCGISLTLPALVAGVAGTVPPTLAGIGAGALNASRQTGAALGVAILGAVAGAGGAAGAPTAGTSGTRTALLLTATVLLAGAAVVALGSRSRHPAVSTR
ncbi:MFS transporter [Actinoplanes sp. NPDC051494]|uniref:MFS transporter n=1 Tax=Actinoplanes sp. NPDC051494 TaxID=3363907 RepID=UPI0037B0A0CA